LYKEHGEKNPSQLVPLLVSGKRNGKTGQVWQGIDPNIRGKEGMHWITIPEKLEEYDRRELIVWPKKEGGIPRLKYFLEESPGVPMNDFWDDVSNITSDEDMRYPTQKPVALLKRIIAASSNEGDIVLDPFCGCGTAIAAAQELNRKWIGIDITHLAIALQKYRLKTSTGLVEKKDYRVIGEPKDLASARQLATENRYQFQWWGLSLVKAMPLGGAAQEREGKKGKDRGVDGIIPFFDNGHKAREALVQVKSGHVGAKDIRDLRGTLERENAPIGVFITLEEATRDMVSEAATAGFYHSPDYNKDYPKMQILTIEEILNGKEAKTPPAIPPTKAAKRIRRESKQTKLF
jgi:site-specific DNA-methyltransferase (adenine-specific)